MFTDLIRRQVEEEGEREVVSILTRDVLVLNKNFFPLCVTTLKDALRLVFIEKAFPLDSEYTSYTLEEWMEKSLKTPQDQVPASIPFNVPNIIRLKTFEKTVRFQLNQSRANIFMRDEYKCQYCRKQLIKSEATIDHIIPKSRKDEFGYDWKQMNDWTNVATCCKKCNGKKSNRTPKEANMPLIKKPTKPEVDLPGMNPNKIHPDWIPFIRGNKHPQEWKFNE